MAIEKGHWPKGGSMPESPEITGDYRCSECGNAAEFIGHDLHGYPGDACECGKVVCGCQVTLRQYFRVNASGEVTYEAFTGGGNGAEIGAYDRIQCGRCGAQVWPPKPKARQHPDLDVANPQGSSSPEFGETVNWPALGLFRAPGWITKHSAGRAKKRKRELRKRRGKGGQHD